MLKRLSLVLAALWLTGCASLSDQLSTLLTILVAVTFLLAAIGAAVTMMTNNSERRVASGLIALVALIAGVLFVVILVA
jgi:hypothetical protein